MNIEQSDKWLGEMKIFLLLVNPISTEKLPLIVDFNKATSIFAIN